ncbi:hypothetical protein J4558_11150 [Leptolyngbya sp. 15MV]|nr:hypothetical protein J4558_11150 [Leptolyngbya sp. 15MV]
MNLARIAFLAPLAALALPGAPAHAKDDPGEAELARLLEGRVAGEPVRCLNGSRQGSVQIVDRTAMVFRDGATLYVNRPDGARILDWNDLPVFRLFGSSMCHRDQVELRDRSTLFPGPVILLGEFVPYRRAGDARPNEGG